MPGSPYVLERSVRHLLTDERVTVRIVPGLSFLDLAYGRLGIDPVEAGVRLVDGHEFAEAAAGERGPLLVAHAHAPWVLSDIKLAADGSGDEEVVVLQRLGLPDERVTSVAWGDLDRSVEPDHLTCLDVPHLGEPVGHELIRFHAIVRACGRSARGTASRPTPASPATPSKRSTSWSRPSARLTPRERPATRTPRWRRSWATSCCRCSSTPPSPSRRAASAWPTSLRPSPRRWCAATPTCSGCGRLGRRARGAQLGHDQGGREGFGCARVAARRGAGRVAGARLRSRADGEGGQGRLRLG